MNVLWSRILAKACHRAYSDHPELAGFEWPLAVWDYESSAFALVWCNNNDVIVAFKGSKELKDWLHDLKVLRVRFGEYKVHRGFAKSLHGLLVPLVDLLHDHVPGKRLWITGHSAGGALATLFLQHLLENCGYTLGESVCGVATFGAPRVYGTLSARRVEKLLNPLLDRYCLLFDKVTKLPPSFLGYRHVGVEYLMDPAHSYPSKLYRALQRVLPSRWFKYHGIPAYRRELNRVRWRRIRQAQRRLHEKR